MKTNINEFHVIISICLGFSLSFLLIEFFARLLHTDMFTLNYQFECENTKNQIIVVFSGEKNL